MSDCSWIAHYRSSFSRGSSRWSEVARRSCTVGKRGRSSFRLRSLRKLLKSRPIDACGFGNSRTGRSLVKTKAGYGSEMHLHVSASWSFMRKAQPGTEFWWLCPWGWPCLHPCRCCWASSWRYLLPILLSFRWTRTFLWCFWRRSCWSVWRTPSPPSRQSNQDRRWCSCSIGSWATSEWSSNSLCGFLKSVCPGHSTSFFPWAWSLSSSRQCWTGSCAGYPTISRDRRWKWSCQLCTIVGVSTCCRTRRKIITLLWNL